MAELRTVTASGAPSAGGAAASPNFVRNFSESSLNVISYALRFRSHFSADIFCWSLRMASASASGRGGQPGR